MTQLAIIGLDCAPPSLVFERCRHVMPNVSRLIDEGAHGSLRSSEPPITVPAWACMTTGRDAGELGLYGFRNRARGDYGLRVASGDDVRPKRVWDYLGDAGHSVAPLFVPLTYPPRPLRGVTMSGFLTPPGATASFPRGLEAELEARFGPYLSDVQNFRTDELPRVWDELHAMGRQHFAIARHIVETRDPAFMMMVEMGPDRFHHAFWSHFDPAHPRHVAGGPYQDAAERYYAFLDEEIGALLETLGEDCTIMIVSDHGAKAMQGGFCINEWLLQRGDLVLRELPTEPTPLREVIDWSRTRAWAEGGYYARLFINVEGRERQGVVPPTEAERVADDIAGALAEVVSPTGDSLRPRCVRPRDAYRRVRGTPPERMIYLDDLRYRALGTVGHGTLFRPTNDGGPDGCNHDWDGIFILHGPDVPRGERVEGATLFDVTPTALGHFGVDVPGLEGVDRLAELRALAGAT